MPELPEVETTCRGIAPHTVGRRICQVIVREARLRHLVPRELPRVATGQVIHGVTRRAKYLLLDCATGHILIHLGMSGNLRVLPATTAVGKHDHLDIVLDSDQCLRFTDPRRFGAVLWLEGDPYQHALLRDLGPEPLSDAFTAQALVARAQGRKVAVKQFLMDSHVVVGVGNIYASESLFRAGVHPTRAAGNVSPARYARVVASVQYVLHAAIAQGGTTLRDFVGGDGQPGYFSQQLCVYGRAGEPCRTCGAAIKQLRQGQRSTYYCPRCQH